MYAKGMTVRDIEDQLRDIYGAEVSPALISNITDKILPQVTEWQNRPLDEIYPVVFFDGVWFKMRKDSKVIKTCVYSVLGINMEGKKEILGIWNSTSESASFWTTVFNELSAFAQAESENKSQSIRWSNERRWNKGIVYCNTDQFFGYTKDEYGKMAIVPEEARLIRRIYGRYNSGQNVRQIAQWLTKKRIPTFYGGEKWSQSSVRNILKNEVYCGDIIRPKRFTKNFLSRKILRNTGQRTAFHQKHHHPAIISREMWNSVQEQLKYRRYARDKPRKTLRIGRMPGTLGAFYLLNPEWDAYDLAIVRERLFPAPPPKSREEIENETRLTECKNLI